MPNMMLSFWYRLYINQTRAEIAFEKEICKLGVRYRTQHIVMGKRAILDFLLPDYNLVIEIDDPGHLKPEGIKKDRERTENLSSLGLKVVRFSNSDVLTDAAGCVKFVAGMIAGKEICTSQVCDVSKKPKQIRRRKPKGFRVVKIQRKAA